MMNQNIKLQSSAQNRSEHAIGVFERVLPPAPTPKASTSILIQRRSEALLRMLLTSFGYDSCYDLCFLVSLFVFVMGRVSCRQCEVSAPAERIDKDIQ